MSWWEEKKHYSTNEQWLKAIVHLTLFNIVQAIARLVDLAIKLVKRGNK